MYDEFDEIRPYHDEELPEVYEELIADPKNFWICHNERHYAEGLRWCDVG